MKHIFLGEVTHYYNKIGVAVLNLVEPIHVGDLVYITGHSTDFEQRVNSLQIDHEEVDEAAAGADVALKVGERVRDDDKIYRVVEDI